MSVVAAAGLTDCEACLWNGAAGGHSVPYFIPPFIPSQPPPASCLNAAPVKLLLAREPLADFLPHALARAYKPASTERTVVAVMPK